MSNAPHSGASPSRLNLEQQRKRAKELLQAHRRGDPDAIARFERQRRGTSEPTLSDAQYVLARAEGFDSWSRLKLHVTQVMQGRKDLMQTLLAAALAGRKDAVESALAIAPELPRQSLHVAAALADEQAVLAQLGASPAPVLRSEAPLNGSPLAYLCHAQLGREL